MGGKPFFVVSQAVDPGLLQVLECDIVPRLENESAMARDAGKFAVERAVFLTVLHLRRRGKIGWQLQ
jgi:hypothetical protein